MVGFLYSDPSRHLRLELLLAHGSQLGLADSTIGPTRVHHSGTAPLPIRQRLNNLRQYDYPGAAGPRAEGHASMAVS